MLADILPTGLSAIMGAKLFSPSTGALTVVLSRAS